MNILVVDNTLMPRFHGSHDICSYIRHFKEAHFHVRRGPEGDLPKDLLKYDGVIISGSKTPALTQAPWIDQLIAAIRKWTDHGTPILGVCYGHQAVSLALNGYESIRRSPTPEAGWSHVKILHPSKILEGLSDPFWTMSFHEDEVHQMSNDFVITANSERCAIQAFELKNKPVFGVQFHPEKELNDVLFAEKDYKKNKRTFYESGRSKELYDPNIGETIFKNFFSLC